MLTSDMRNPLLGSTMVSGRPFCAEAGARGVKASPLPQSGRVGRTKIEFLAMQKAVKI